MPRTTEPKHILITGCSSGIGLAAAQELYQRGHHVIATCRNLADKEQIEKLGVHCVMLDLNDDASIAEAVRQTLVFFDNRIDALFNNAAFGQPGAVEDLSRDVLQAQFNTNVFGTQQLTNSIIRHMRQQGQGRIIYNSSVLGLIALPYRGAYNASKFALEGLADTLRLELHGSDIWVSLIEPGPIISQFRANAFKQYQRNIDAQNSAHRHTYVAMENRLKAETAQAPFTLPASAVVSKLIHAVESRRPKIRYFVTFPTYLFAFLKRVLPARALDWVLRKVSQNEQR